MNDLISRRALLAEYDRVHIGEPGKARKLIEDAPCIPNYEEELKIRCAEVAELKRYISRVDDERSKLGIEFEQALKHIDELNGEIAFLKGQVEAYQYCVNCRR